MKRNFPLFLLFLPLFCAAENLFPEWEKEYKANAKVTLPEWRISYWGTSEKGTAQWKIADEHLVLYRKGASPQGTYAMIRTVPLAPNKTGKVRFFRLSATVSGPKAALIQFSLSGGHNTKKIYSNTAPEPQNIAVETTVSAQCRQLTAVICLYGTGEAEFSNLRLEEVPEAPKVQIQSNLFGRTFEIGENVPGTAVLNGVHLPLKGELKIKVRLPRGYRLTNTSKNSTMIDAKPLPGGVSEYLLNAQPSYGSLTLMLLLESLIPPSPEAASGEIELDWGSGKEAGEISFRTVPAIHVTAPRHFEAGLFWRSMLDPDEARERLNKAAQSCGANFICGGHAVFSVLSRGKIRRFAELPAISPLRSGICKYAEIRNESFWEKRFTPAMRHLNVQTTDLIAAADLGQKTGIFCLCPLCRAEFSDFAPKLPQRRIMNLSAGQLHHYYGKELQAFRTARWHSLLDAAPHHLLAGRRPFLKKPRFWSLFNVQDFSPEIAGLKKLSRAAIRMTSLPALLPDNEFPQDLTMYLMAKETRNRFPKTELLALLPPAPQESLYSAQRTGFLLTGFFAAGFNGVCADLQSGGDYRNFAGFAAAMKRIQPYERWSPVTAGQSGIKAECDAEKFSLPVLPAYGQVTFPLPPEHSSIVTAFRKRGKEVLAMVGNFGFQEQSCTLKALNGTPAKRTVTVAPQHWEFVTFRTK